VRNRFHRCAESSAVLVSGGSRDKDEQCGIMQSTSSCVKLRHEEHAPSRNDNQLTLATMLFFFSPTLTAAVAAGAAATTGVDIEIG